MRVHVARQTRARHRAHRLRRDETRRGSSNGSRPSWRQGRSIVSLDVVDDETLQWVGGLIWDRRGQGIFAIGSQGVEYALVAHWRARACCSDPSLQILLPNCPRSLRSRAQSPKSPPLRRTGRRRMGSTSSGSTPRLASTIDLWNAEIDSAVKSALASLSSGRSPLVATARGPNDSSLAKFREKLSTSGVDSIEVNGRIGSGLGEILQRVMRRARIKRGVVSGGHFSGFAIRALGAYALEAVAPIAPGAPLCRVFSTDPETDGFQITLKGGQMGEVDFFGLVRAGSTTA